ncbi:MAG: cyclic nucleotide-binding domain-containing protein [Candidatus Sumerlaeota bacterium]|nr:cyclic nucleotide-binding domain-containing protein [Candidatus Sumerlaeota bacterium]
MMERARLLEASSWARDLAFAQIETLARRMRCLLLRAGDAVFLEGDREAFLCLIIRGQISIRKMNSRRANRLIARIGPGQAFGEMSLIDGSPRSASALAEEDSMVFLLTKEEFNALMQETPQLALKLMLKISRMMSLRLRKTSAELAEHLEDI